MSTKFYRLLSFIFLAFICQGKVAAQACDTCSMTDEERAVVAEVNFVRTEPKRYAQEVLVPFLSLFTDDNIYHEDGINMHTREGVAAVQEAIDELSTITPLPPLKPLEALNLAARFHSQDIGPKGLTQHASSDGTSMHERVKRYCPNATTTGECIGFGCGESRKILRQLIVDDGVKNRGHRVILLNRDLHRIGVGIGTHKVYRSMCTIDMTER